MCVLHRSSSGQSSKDNHHLKGDSHTDSSSSNGSPLLELFTQQCSKWLAVFTLPELRDVVRAFCDMHYRSDTLVQDIEQQVSAHVYLQPMLHCREHTIPITVGKLTSFTVQPQQQYHVAV
jgi:hypothetical protein